MNLFLLNKEQIIKFCEIYKVKNLSAFGSVLTEQFNEKSDTDLLVSFGEIKLLEYSDNYFNLKYGLENLLKKPVDLIEEKAIRNPYFKENIDRRRKLIY